MQITILPFEPRYSGKFRDLNLDWLNRYFAVEEKDRELLERCEEEIIHPGGMIFFAETEGAIVGCFAFIRIGDDVFELGKMAVDPPYQGRQIGQALLRHAVAYARERQWKKIILYSSTKLDRALHLYRKFGFREVAMEQEVPYVRSDIKMELPLLY